MDTKVPFKDRLRDRGFVDQWGFFVFASVGFAAIFSAKWLNAPPSWVVFGALAAMLVYAVLIGRAGTGRLRGDQAGDNCYYLGLIYTLASLSYAIASFDPNDPASTIVQGFGIALGTTILGLILRVFFNQGRPDMENAEEIARIELTEASARLRRELNLVVLNMNDLGRQLNQSMVEVQDAAKQSMQDCASNSVQGIQAVATAASEAIRAEANDFAGRSKRYNDTFNNLLSRLDEHNEKLSELNGSYKSLAAATQLASNAAASAAETVQTVARGADQARSAVLSIDAAATSTEAVVRELLATTSEIRSVFSAIGNETKQQLSELGKGPSDTVRVSVEAVRDAAAVLQMQMQHLTSVHSETTTMLANQTAAAVNVAKTHNNELENELKRSRDLVSHVHSALADMTRSLAETVERN